MPLLVISSPLVSFWLLLFLLIIHYNYLLGLAVYHLFYLGSMVSVGAIATGLDSICRKLVY